VMINANPTPITAPDGSIRDPKRWHWHPRGPRVCAPATARPLDRAGTSPTRFGLRTRDGPTPRSRGYLTARAARRGAAPTPCRVRDSAPAPPASACPTQRPRLASDSLQEARTGAL
jgi:hypothetical protein